MDVQQIVRYWLYRHGPEDCQHGHADEYINMMSNSDLLMHISLAIEERLENV